MMTVQCFDSRRVPRSSLDRVPLNPLLGAPLCILFILVNKYSGTE